MKQTILKVPEPMRCSVSVPVVSEPKASSSQPSPLKKAESSKRPTRPAVVREASLGQIRILACKEFGDRLRSGWVLACVLLWLGAIGLTSFLGLLQIGRIGVQGYERTVMSLLNLVQYLIPLLGLLLAHDLIVGEREDRTLGLLIGRGIGRVRVLLAKFIGGALTLTVPLILGFVLAGAGIGLTARDSAVLPFIRLAVSSLGLGLIFLGIGLAISVFVRTRVQALVLALLTWCLAVFVFDLVALGLMVSTKAHAAAEEIDVICDATHVNTSADIHSAYDATAAPGAPHSAKTAEPTLDWLAANPVDVFRVLNLPDHGGVGTPMGTIAFSGLLWLALPFGVGAWRFRRSDL